MNAVIRATVWWIRDYAYALVWQTRAYFNRTAPSSFRAGNEVPIVVLPGVFETWKFMQPLVEEMHAKSHPVHIVEMLRRNQRPIAEMAEEVARFLQVEDLEDVVLVAHSKGGLAGKLVMVGPAGHRVRGMVAIATPFGGSRYARLMPGRTLRAFAPSDPSIVSLARNTEANSRVVSIYARFDPHIPEGSELPGAKNVLLETGGHFRVLAHPRVVAELTALSS